MVGMEARNWGMGVKVYHSLSGLQLALQCNGPQAKEALRRQSINSGPCHKLVVRKNESLSPEGMDSSRGRTTAGPT